MLIKAPDKLVFMSAKKKMKRRNYFYMKNIVEHNFPFGNKIM